MSAILVNGVRREVTSSPDTPLLYVLKNDLDLSSPQFGCGMAQCGSCSVLLAGVEVRACITPLSEAAGKEVTTLEGLPDRWARQNRLAGARRRDAVHPVQEAWIEQQTPLCGFCQSGMMIKATELLEANPSPSLDQIKAAFTTSGTSPHLCRCGSYKAIVEGVQRAAEIMRQKKGARRAG
jgi:isoquinoline 1-oxidoreductase alpha subunit